MGTLSRLFIIAGLLSALMLQGCDSSKPEKVLFDDFTYTDLQGLQSNGWLVRTLTAHPGVAGATWSADGISFHDDTDKPGNRFLRMTSQTDGTGANTRHTQFCHARKYHEGTYAARVYFRNDPSYGPDGDQVVQTFYIISPLKAPMNLDYSEADFEYLPNGGWEHGELTLFATTWETFQLEPWTKDNKYDTITGDYSGWHTLVLQVTDGSVRYFVDGVQFADHGEHVYPEEPMSINFNMWFTQEGLLSDSSEMRGYEEDIDWVFHQPGAVLSTAEVEKKVADLRAKSVAFQDTVPELNPPLESPCGL